MKYIYHDSATKIYQLQAEEEYRPKKLFHYTSTEVLDILLNNCTFRASNVFYLNDAMEYKAGIEELDKQLSYSGKRILSTIKQENGTGLFNSGIFSISFSQEKDSLYQWITYAKESGIAIELDDRLIMSKKKTLWYGVESYDMCNDNDTSYENLLFIALRLALRPVIYNYTKTNFLQIDEIKDDYKEKYMWYASFFKQNGFEAENEVRLSVFAMQNTSGKKSKVMYYPLPQKGILRPYLNVTFGYYNREDIKKVFNPCLPLKSITIGPSGKQQAVFDSIVHRVKYGDMKVYNYAKIPEDLSYNFSNYINELLVWMIKKEFVNHIDMNWTNRTGIMKRITKNNVLLYRVKQLFINNFNDTYQTIKSKLGIQFINVIIGISIKSWINRNESYLLGLKDSKANLIYDVKYLSIPKFDSDIPSAINYAIQEKNKDFYFSKEGILIQKSNIPYIF